MSLHDDKPQYGDRDVIGLGDRYTRHVQAMTAEDLHRKSDIAAELAHRDAEVDALRAEVERLRAALSRVARWHGEFPPTGREWQDHTPMSYSAAFGSNGERDFMRQVALDALAGAPVLGAGGLQP